MNFIIKIRPIVFLCFLFTQISFAQTFEGYVNNSESNQPLQNVTISIVEDGVSATTDSRGFFSIQMSEFRTKTITADLEGYMFFEKKLAPEEQLEIALRQKKKSKASFRWDNYILNRENYNNLDYNNDPFWTVSFTETQLRGGLAPNRNIVKRDPSAVIKVDGVYYVWYTYSTGTVRGFGTGDPNAKVFPWDLSDIWYATSTDGYTWQEQGPAVERGARGSYDDRSVFTAEILAHEGKYYLVYQTVKAPYVQRVKNNVGMSVADSPNGPWTKLDAPILSPTNNGIWKGTRDNRFSVHKKGDFDSHKVHDPCLIVFKDKFYLYYKGERMGEERYFGQREIKWGVAIADNPLGPYEKSEYNPITNTGHEVCVWPYKNGIALINTLDGPERETIQFAEDGLNFEIKSTARNLPHAFGLFRGDISTTDPHKGITWGLSHQLVWDKPGGWMYLTRFDIVNPREEFSMKILEENVRLSIGGSSTITPIFTPASSSQAVLWSSSDEDIATVNNQGEILGKAIGSAIIYAKTIDGNFEDSLVVNVVEGGGVEVLSQVIQAESFVATGTAGRPDWGGHDGVNRSAIGINWVNTTDFVDYNVNISETGYYDLSYNISTPMNAAEITLSVNGNALSVDAVPNNRQWDDYYNLDAATPIFLEAGLQTLRIIASGSNTWQWNLDYFTITYKEDQTGLKKASLGTDDIQRQLSAYPNPTSGKLHIDDLHVDIRGISVYNLIGMKMKSEVTLLENGTSIDLSNLPGGMYIVEVKSNFNTQSFSVVKL